MRHKDFRVTKTVSLPLNVVGEIDERAFAENLGFSAKLLVLVRKGILFEDKYQSGSLPPQVEKQ